MTKKEKISMLRTAAQLVYRCSERTPPKAKKSTLNIKVAEAAIGIENLIKHLM